jgi:hypothetical protein
MVVIARGFGFAMIGVDEALEGADFSRKGDKIAVVTAVRRSMKNLDGRDRPQPDNMLLEKKIIHTTTKKPCRSPPGRRPLILCLNFTFKGGTS